MLNLKDFNYNLPKELIAQYPAKERRLSRLMIVDRKNKSIEHRQFGDLINFLKKGDALVLNNTYCLPARLRAKRKNTGAKLEVLLIRKIRPFVYEALIKPSKRAKKEEDILIGDSKVRAKIIEDIPPKKVITFDGIKDLDKILEKEGEVPLPPYIKRTPDEIDRIRYQTVYAKDKGAVASPTAGLHFDEEYLNQIKEKGIKITYLTLHISYGTFKPITEEDLLKGKLFAEYFRIEKDAVDVLNRVKSDGGRIIAVGTSSCRGLESAYYNKRLNPVEGETELFIYPPYKFKFTDCLITNFHLPKSSLLMLVSAFFSDVDNLTIDEGHNFLMKVYSEAIKKGYRFYSYGDAMFIQ